MAEIKNEIMILLSTTISILLSITSFAWAYFQADYESTTKSILIFGVFWFIALWKRWRWFPTLALSLGFCLAIFGLINDLSLVWMVSGAIFALIAWDLNQFQIRLNLLPDREDKQGMTRRRLIRIVFLVVIGLGIAVGMSWVFGN